MWSVAISATGFSSILSFRLEFVEQVIFFVGLIALSSLYPQNKYLCPTVMMIIHASINV